MKSEGKLTTVDASALCKALEDVGAENVSMAEGELSFWVSRYAMDSLGYHVGYEVYRGDLNLYSKENFQHYIGAPSIAEPHFCIIEQLDGELVDAPDEYDVGDDEDSEGYHHPDPEFVYDELKDWLGEAMSRLPEWSFNKGLREEGYPIEECWELC